MLGIDMMVDSFLEGLGTSTKDLKETFEKAKVNIPVIVKGLQDKVGEIEATQTRIEFKQDLILAHLGIQYANAKQGAIGDGRNGNGGSST